MTLRAFDPGGPHCATLPGLSVTELTSVSELESMRAEWMDLWERCDGISPFQRPEWIISWCRHFDCRGIWSLAVKCETRLVVLAPWLVYEKDGQRVVAFLAGGVSDYHDVLADPAFADAAVPELFLHLVRRRAAWDECDFEQLRPGSKLGAVPASACFLEERTEQEACLKLTLPGLAASLSDVVPVGQLARFRKYRRRAQRQGTIELQLAPAGARPKALDELFDLHRARWNEEGHPEIAISDVARAFHRDLVSQMSPPVIPELYRLELGGSATAVLYGFRAREVFHCYMQGFNPAYSDMSPGMLLVGAVLENLQHRGVVTVDFLRGNEPYKLAWGAKGLSNQRRRLRLRDRAAR